MGKSTHNLTQQMLILEYCSKHRGITSLDAVRDLGIIRLASRINDLKSCGYSIITEWVKVPNRYGDLTRVKKYYVSAPAGSQK